MHSLFKFYENGIQMAHFPFLSPAAQLIINWTGLSLFGKEDQCNVFTQVFGVWCKRFTLWRNCNKNSNTNLYNWLASVNNSLLWIIYFGFAKFHHIMPEYEGGMCMVIPLNCTF